MRKTEIITITEETDTYYCDICSKQSSDSDDITRCTLCKVDICYSNKCQGMLWPLSDGRACKPCEVLAAPFLQECSSLDKKYNEDKQAIRNRLYALKK